MDTMNKARAKRLVAVASLTALTVVLLACDALACPTCKDGMSGSDPVSVARATGYFYSILFMMSMPFVIVSTFGGAAYLSIRKAKQRQLQSETPAGQP